MASDWTFYAVASEPPLSQPVCQLLRLRNCPGEPIPDGGRGGDQDQKSDDKDKDKNKDEKQTRSGGRVPDKPDDTHRGQTGPKARLAAEWTGVQGLTVVPVVLRLE